MCGDWSRGRGITQPARSAAQEGWGHPHDHQAPPTAVTARSLQRGGSAPSDWEKEHAAQRPNLLAEDLREDRYPDGTKPPRAGSVGALRR